MTGFRRCLAPQRGGHAHARMLGLSPPVLPVDDDDELTESPFDNLRNFGRRSDDSPKRVGPDSRGHGERDRACSYSSRKQVQKTCEFWLFTSWLLTFSRQLLPPPPPSM